MGRLDDLEISQAQKENCGNGGKDKQKDEGAVRIHPLSGMACVDALGSAANRSPNGAADGTNGADDAGKRALGRSYPAGTLIAGTARASHIASRPRRPPRAMNVKCVMRRTRDASAHPDGRNPCPASGCGTIAPRCEKYSLSPLRACGNNPRRACRVCGRPYPPASSARRRPDSGKARDCPSRRSRRCLRAARFCWSTRVQPCQGRSPRT